MFLFWVFIGGLAWAYLGYPAVVIALSRLGPRLKSGKFLFHELPAISVLVSAYNEEAAIAKRIENIQCNSYPDEKMEIILASDGSADGTVQRAKELLREGVVIQDHKSNRGRAAIQNDGVSAARGEIVVFTDAGTEFAPGFLVELVQPFSDSSVGCVIGNLIYKGNERLIAVSEGKYFSFEKTIREAESSLGILATGTGACMAVRKTLWRELTPIDDCDFTTPLDVVLQGYRNLYCPSAVAYDQPTSTIGGELKVRIRQTSKNFVGTLKRWGLRGWTQHPFVSLGLLSHKFLRWLTPFFLLGFFFSTLVLVSQSLFFAGVFLLELIFFLTALIGLIGYRIGVTIPMASMALAFCTANIGMGIGVVKGLLGKAPSAYKKAV